MRLWSIPLNLLPHSAKTHYTLHVCSWILLRIWMSVPQSQNKRYVSLSGDKTLSICWHLYGCLPFSPPFRRRFCEPPPSLAVSGSWRLWLCCIHFNPISTIVTVIPYCSNFSRLLSLPQTCQLQHQCPITPTSPSDVLELDQYTPLLNQG